MTCQACVRCMEGVRISEGPLWEVLLYLATYLHSGAIPFSVYSSEVCPLDMSCLTDKPPNSRRVEIHYLYGNSVAAKHMSIVYNRVCLYLREHVIGGSTVHIESQ